MALEARCVTSRQGPSPWSSVLMSTHVSQILSPPGNSTSPSGAIPTVNTHKCQSCCCARAVTHLPQAILGMSSQITFGDVTGMAMMTHTSNALVCNRMKLYIM